MSKKIVKGSAESIYFVAFHSFNAIRENGSDQNHIGKLLNSFIFEYYRLKTRFTKLMLFVMVKILPKVEKSQIRSDFP